ncbi:hypothetical protein AOLI_G00313790 [Acnodon oligacanthus]
MWIQEEHGGRFFSRRPQSQSGPRPFHHVRRSGRCFSNNGWLSSSRGWTQESKLVLAILISDASRLGQKRELCPGCGGPPLILLPLLSGSRSLRSPPDPQDRHAHTTHLHNRPTSASEDRPH